MSNNGDRAAFPDGTYTSSGMTQRQYYKATALAGLMANPSVVGVDPEGWTELCGRVADAMITGDARHEAK